MKSKLSSINKMLILSVGFTILLLVIRIVITHQLTYIFYAWNLFLATIPLWFCNKLQKQNKLSFKSYFLIFGWLLFFPNAPYIVTDLFHYVERPPIPFWYDLLIVITAAWNGLLLGLISLFSVESFLAKYVTALKLKFAMAASFVLCGFGVYLGRYLRFNSWDIVSNIDDLFYQISYRFIHPFRNSSTWSFTILFAAMMAIFYYTIKAISVAPKKSVHTS